jgi:hypothetical protein
VGCVACDPSLVTVSKKIQWSCSHAEHMTYKLQPEGGRDIFMMLSYRSGISGFSVSWRRKIFVSFSCCVL